LFVGPDVPPLPSHDSDVQIEWSLLRAEDVLRGNSGAASSNPPSLAFKPNGTPPVKLIGKLALDITLRQSAGGAAPRTRTTTSPCNNQGDASVTIVCSDWLWRSHHLRQGEPAVAWSPALHVTVTTPIVDTTLLLRVPHLPRATI